MYVMAKIEGKSIKTPKLNPRREDSMFLGSHLKPSILADSSSRGEFLFRGGE